MTHDALAALVLLLILGLNSLACIAYGIRLGTRWERARAASTRRSMSLARIQQRRHGSWDARS